MRGRNGTDSKAFSELSAEELFEIYKLRISVFVVEQKCPYQEVDDADRAAYHLWLKDEDGIEAYARVLPRGVTFPTEAIGRVIAVKRRCGLGSKILEAAIHTEKKSFRQIQSPLKHRCMHVHCMRSTAFGRLRKNFWKTVFRTF